tara:strand:+ start:277 stop:486 length:210 start_codon:yes stop_codon:yes gene_type:complete
MRMASVGGIYQPLSNLEHKVMDQIAQQTMCKRDMPERDAYIAQELVNRGILNKDIRDNTVYYNLNKGNY